MYHVRSVVIETSKLATILKLSFLPLTLLIISTKWGPKETGIKTKIACFWSMFWTSFMTLVSVVSWLANVSFTGYFKGWYCLRFALLLVGYNIMFHESTCKEKKHRKMSLNYVTCFVVLARIVTLKLAHVY